MEIIFFVITSAGINSLLLPASPIGVITGFSLSKGNEAVFYNPANFTAGDDFKLNCFYNQFYLGLQSFSLALSKKIKDLNLGLGIINFDYGDMELKPDYPTEEPLLNYSAHDFSLGLCGSVKTSAQSSIGINFKYISENIYIYSDYTFAFDVSLAYRNDQAGVSFGVTNFGYQISLKNEEVNLPARLILGGYRNFKNFVTSFDLAYLINNGGFEFGLGGELPVGKFIELKAGVNYHEKFSPGFGFNFIAGKFVVKYGAAIYPFNLGMINTLGIGVDF